MKRKIKNKQKKKFVNLNWEKEKNFVNNIKWIYLI